MISLSTETMQEILSRLQVVEQEIVNVKDFVDYVDEPVTITPHKSYYGSLKGAKSSYTFNLPDQPQYYHYRLPDPHNWNKPAAKGGMTVRVEDGKMRIAFCSLDDLFCKQTGRATCDRQYCIPIPTSVVHTLDSKLKVFSYIVCNAHYNNSVVNEFRKLGTYVGDSE